MQNMSGKSALGLDANVAGLLAYIPFCLIGPIISILIIVQDKSNKLARFHAFQALLLFATIIVLYVVCGVIIGAGAAADSGLIASLGGLLYIGVALLGLIAIVLCCIKAFQGQVFKLPIIGGLADKFSG